MEVKRVVTPAEFLERAGPLLLEDEARHNLILGIADALNVDPARYRTFHLWVVVDSGRVVSAALQTPPFNITVARPATASALTALARAIHEDGLDLPGVTAAVPEVDLFADAWEAQTGTERSVRMVQRIYRLARQPNALRVPGKARRATRRDRALLVAWMKAFSDEAMGESDQDAVERGVDARLRSSTSGFLLWEAGEPVAQPVSMAGWGGTTPSGIRISAVYTPPQFRRRGYGSAVTAAVSAEQLAAGRRFCFLYTDLANSTSNKIYMDIGYEPVCDSMDYAFEP